MTKKKPRVKIEPSKVKATFEEKMLKLGKGLKNLMRGMQGLPPEGEDQFSGMINVKDIRERTRLNLHQIYSHAYMRLAGAFYPDIMKDWVTVAEEEEHLFISQDGEQRKEAIMYKQPRIEVVSAQPSGTIEPKSLEKKEGKKE